MAYTLTRLKNTTMQQISYKRSKTKPEKMGDMFKGQVQKMLGDKYNPVDWSPRYGPWDQRLCLIPDANLFEAISRGAADVVTDHIDRFTEKGILTKGGKELEADIVVVATGLHMEVMEGVDIQVDGVKRTVGASFSYKGCMYGDIPNLMSAFGYSNASWTLKADLIAEYMCRFLKHLDASKADYGVPVPTGVTEDAEGLMNLSSGYVERSKGRVPLMGHVYPWRAYHDYKIDKKLMRNEPMDDGWMKFHKAGPVASAVSQAPELAVAAE
jgi:cation diffusion facilitator CzcD-associated flavoprotein CzcO